MQLDYLDLYLIHTPFSFENIEGDLHPVDENGNIKIDIKTDHIAVWKEMEKQVIAGRTRAIGLSNFNVKQINRILENSTVPIANLQIELHVNFQQKELVSFFFSFYVWSCLILIPINKLIYFYFRLNFVKTRALQSLRILLFVTVDWSTGLVNLR